MQEISEIKKGLHLMTLFSELPLPNGSVIPNRIAKAAMEENMADLDHAPSEELLNLYEKWANGGSGLIITGNVMIDRRAMTGAGGVVLEDDTHIEKFRKWAQIGRSKGAQFWMQINHPGRQMPADLGQETWAPSSVPINLGKMSKNFSVPNEMSEEKIQEVVQRFVNTALLSQEAGFTGVEIHAAHGYLLSQFLSPLTNRRTDRWGGSLENRASFLIDVIKAVKSAVSDTFTVAVKLNSADFQRGGFSHEDACKVVEMLNPLKVDLIELSGGSYEAPAMQGQARDGKTLEREAYFLEFAKDIQKVAQMPVMITGGIRRHSIANKVIENKVDMIGIATALAIEPNLPNNWFSGKDSAPQLLPIKWKNKPFASLANMAMVKYQLRKLGANKKPNPRVLPLWALVCQLVLNHKRAKHYRHMMS